MAWEHQKSASTLSLDVARHLLVLAAAVYAIVHVWNWHWVAGVVAALPIYILALNLVGFATLPLYSFTPENRLKARAYRAFKSGDMELGKALTEEFSARFKVNLPTGGSDAANE